MATQLVKLRRSATSGAIPTTSQLELGELAVNTYDGKLYMKKDVGGTESVVEVGAGGFQGTSTFELYEYEVTSAQTTFSGSDSNGNTLAYDLGSGTNLSSVLVYLNGLLLDYGLDYTATTGTSVVLSAAAESGDLVSIGAFKHDIEVQGDLSFDDNQQVKFGDDDDLRIYHNGTNSIIDEAGTGNLDFQVAGTTVFSLTPTGLTLANWPESEYEVRGDLDGGIKFSAEAGEALSKGDAVYISGNSGDVPIVEKADASNSATMPAWGLVWQDAANGADVQIMTFGALYGTGAAPLDTTGFTIGDSLYVSDTTAGQLTNVQPSGENSLLQNIGKVQRVQANNGIIRVGGAGRTNAVPNLNDGKIFIGNTSNKAVTASFATTVETYLDTNGLTLPDNIKAQFGASNDLQIFHDGSNSYVKDAGTGSLILEGTQLVLQSAAGETYLSAVNDGAITLYHDNVSKFATTSTGVSVTGNISGVTDIDASGDVTVSNELNIDQLNIHTHVTTTTSTTQTEICDMSAATYRTSKLLVQASDSVSGDYHVVEITTLHDGTTAYHNEYGEILTGSSLATFSVDINAGNVRLLATPASTNSTTFKVVNYSVTV